MSAEKHDWLVGRGLVTEAGRAHACPVCGQVHVASEGDAVAVPAAVVVSAPEEG